MRNESVLETRFQQQQQHLKWRKQFRQKSDKTTTPAPQGWLKMGLTKLKSCRSSPEWNSLTPETFSW